MIHANFESTYKTAFIPGQIYLRRSQAPLGRYFRGRVFIKERGIVREASADRVVMDVFGPLPGVEIIGGYGHGAGWKPEKAEKYSELGARI